MHKAIGRILAALGVLALAVGIAQSSLVQPKSTGSLPHRSPNAGTQAPEQNPWGATTCTVVDVIPEGRPGNFCIDLRKGVSVKILPPPYTNTKFCPSVPVAVEFRGWKDEFIERKTIQGKDEFIPFPKGTKGFVVTPLEKEGTMQVLIGGTRLSDLGTCS